MDFRCFLERRSCDVYRRRMWDLDSDPRDYGHLEVVTLQSPNLVIDTKGSRSPHGKSAQSLWAIRSNSWITGRETECLLEKLVDAPPIKHGGCYHGGAIRLDFISATLSGLDEPSTISLKR